MNEQEKHAASQEERKEKIRARYKGVDRSELEFIPAKQKEKLFEDAGTKRVCAYCRVSTDDANQTWNKDCKYKLRGQFCGTADEQVMIFELEEPEVLVQEKAEEQFAEETEKKAEEAQKPVKKIFYPEAWAYNFGESTNRMVFLQRVSYKGNWDILRPARTVEGMEIITREVLNELLESAEKLIDKMRCANYA